ncbi:MAG: hypothetical protein M1617_07130 [Actinobacteria bacterium]|nr:hypothetical protein [Actinomycetota bacterium]MCL5888041.1 hypothetical protein [Actinomycetota bacterium]
MAEKVPEAPDLEGIYAAKIHADLMEAEQILGLAGDGYFAGSMFAQVMLAKGIPGPAESAGGSPLSGADGEAIGKALTALGFDAAKSFKTLTRPFGSAHPDDAVASRLRLQIEAVDPFWIIALDRIAAADVALALGIDVPDFGRPIHIRDRVVHAVDGFEEALSDESRKRVIWGQLRKVPRPTGL